MPARISVIAIIAEDRIWAHSSEEDRRSFVAVLHLILALARPFTHSVLPARTCRVMASDLLRRSSPLTAWGNVTTIFHFRSADFSLRFPSAHIHMLDKQLRTMSRGVQDHSFEPLLFRMRALHMSGWFTTSRT